MTNAEGAGSSRDAPPQPALTGGAGPALTGPPQTEEKTCSDVSCPLDCVVSAWVVSHGCSVSCGPIAGTTILAREILTKASLGGTVCPAVRQIQQCYAGPCPTHCFVTPFELWGKCSASCGGGVQERRRSVVALPSSGGSVCPALLDTRPCNMLRCKQDCLMASFGPWGTCSNTCGGGYKWRLRAVVRRSRFGGKSCPHSAEHDKCASAPCPVDCIPTPFSDWTPCSTMCGEGTRERFRSIARAAAFDGRRCPAVLHQIRSCFRWTGCSLNKGVFAVAT